MLESTSQVQRSTIDVDISRQKGALHGAADSPVRQGPSFTDT